MCTVGKNHFTCELGILGTWHLSGKKKSQGTFNSSQQLSEKKNVSGGMSTIALQLFGGEREEKAREREVPGYIV